MLLKELACAVEGRAVSLSIDELASIRDGPCRLEQASALAHAAVRRLLVDIARSVDQDGVRDHNETICPVSRPTDIPANQHIGVWQVNPTRNLPVRVVTLVSNVNALAQIRVLVNCHPWKQGARRVWRPDVEYAALT